ncbi:DNA-binding Xre family transcriptional regulator [Peribacillus huizhouensis]|uniref:DNA-binding Xre family transcriptional regulator n=1 Tax=Peribacillus huizhouensis TaxID=1501239 RepID=A0ABR6CT85_9BACI|nr:DNA-binding Xre family transcriptional regulator [Peribacillus huizhouensis]
MIKINLDRVMLERKISTKALAEKIRITQVNLSILKTGKAWYSLCHIRKNLPDIKLSAW